MKELSKIQQMLLLTGRTPKIAAGASSNSEVLNQFFQTLHSDLVRNIYRISMIDNKLAATQQLTAIQGAALSTYMNQLITRLESLTGSGQVLLDFHTTNYLHGDNTAEINLNFGQATLPISQETNLLVYTDAFGQPVIPTEIECYAAWVEGGGTPAVTDYKLAPLGLQMLKETDFWLESWPGTDPADTDLWLRIDFPYELFSLQPNIIEIWPAPCFGTTIKQVDYQTPESGFDTGWYPVGFDYVTQYNPSVYGNPYINNAGPIRLFLEENTLVSSLRIRMVSQTAGPMGVAYVRLLSTVFDTSAILKVTNPYGYTIATTQINGRYPNDLQALGTSVAGTDLTVSLTSNSPKVTPVITSLVLSE